MRQRYLQGSELDLMALLKDREARKEFLEEIKFAFFKKLKETTKKRRQRIDESKESADIFEKAFEGVFKLTKSLSEISKKAFQEFISQPSIRTQSQEAFANAIALGTAENIILQKLAEDAPQEQKNKFSIDFKRAGEALNPDFTGPLLKPYENARRKGDVTELNKEFSAYTNILRENGHELEFKGREQGGFKVVFRNISQNTTTHTKYVSSAGATDAPAYKHS